MNVILLARQEEGRNSRIEFQPPVSDGHSLDVEQSTDRTAVADSIRTGGHLVAVTTACSRGRAPAAALPSARDAYAAAPHHDVYEMSVINGFPVDVRCGPSSWLGAILANLSRIAAAAAWAVGARRWGRARS
jgi:hypothetical protein